MPLKPIIDRHSLGGVVWLPVILVSWLLSSSASAFPCRVSCCFLPSFQPPLNSLSHLLVSGVVFIFLCPSFCSPAACFYFQYGHNTCGLLLLLACLCDPIALQLDCPAQTQYVRSEFLPFPSTTNPALPSVNNTFLPWRCDCTDARTWKQPGSFGLVQYGHDLIWVLHLHTAGVLPAW